MTWTTLPEVIYRMVSEGKTKTPEFQAIVTFYGKEKVKALYQKEKQRRQNVSNADHGDRSNDNDNNDDHQKA